MALGWGGLLKALDLSLSDSAALGRIIIIMMISLLGFPDPDDFIMIDDLEQAKNVGSSRRRLTLFDLL